MYLPCVLSSADPSIGKVPSDKSSFSQRSLMDLLIAGFHDTRFIAYPNEISVELSEWPGVTLSEDGNVTQISWINKGISGTIDLQWIPLTVTVFNVMQNAMYGTLDLTTLPESLVSFNAMSNRFDGTLNLTRLPAGLVHLNISKNNFSGVTDFSKLPATLFHMDLSHTDLQGVVPRGMTVRFQGSRVVME